MVVVFAGMVVDISVVTAAVVETVEDGVVRETAWCAGWVVVVAGVSGGTAVFLACNV